MQPTVLLAMSMVNSSIACTRTQQPIFSSKYNTVIKCNRTTPTIHVGMLLCILSLSMSTARPHNSRTLQAQTQETSSVMLFLRNEAVCHPH
mmetsp:Transcript_64790/g.154718  ORF Transcript_64790/g.154718 Transcript_64790/m.154718 type:complete len:91 (-) Transcript_64790:293-565(-)